MGRHSRPEAAPVRAPWQRPVVVLAALLVVLAVVAVVLATQGSDDAGARADVQTTPAPISSTSPTPTPAPTSPTPSPAATRATSAPASTAPTPAASPAASATPSPTPPPLLSFTVLRAAWISVTDSSGHQLVARVFRAGEKASYDGPAFTVRTGNAGGVRFVVDGKPRSLGGSGQVESFTVRG